tara:strand:- start:639 stop:779 length:141 start_codon:yes stop_codon:yes gene_type:complete
MAEEEQIENELYSSSTEMRELGSIKPKRGMRELIEKEKICTEIKHI